MTYEEALQLLRESKKYWARIHPIYKAHDVAIEAIEKQILKKPIDITVSRLDSHMISCRCPKCNTRQSYGSIDWHKWFNKRCFECGQALDWSDEK